MLDVTSLEGPEGLEGPPEPPIRVVPETVFGNEDVDDDSEEMSGEEDEEVIVDDESPPAPGPFVASHISRGSLNTLSFIETEYGWVPVTSRVPIPLDTKSKFFPVDFGVDTGSPILNQAMLVAQKVLANRASLGAQEKEVKALVGRARMGDQNAMAILALVRRNASMGHERAQCAYAHIRDYIRENPPSTMHGENIEPKMWAFIWLANGPMLTDTKLREFGASFGQDEPVFLHGLMFFRYKDKLAKVSSMFDALRSKVLEIGQMFGQARNLQLVRLPASNLRAFNPRVGWELGA
jgi:hypothetical protein